MAEEVAGLVPWCGLHTVAAGVAAVPMTAVFIGLGVSVLIGGSLSGRSAQRALGLPHRRGLQPDPGGEAAARGSVRTSWQGSAAPARVERRLRSNT